MTSVLMVLTGADTWTMKDGRRHPTGFWAEEFIKPHKAFTAAGYTVEVATPRGRRPVVDDLSLSLQYNDNDAAGVEAQKEYLSQQNMLQQPLVLGDVDPAAYDVVFVVGGHGPMQDLAVDPDLGKIFAAMLGSQSKVLAAVCHGPASFLSAFDENDEWLFKGRKLTGFSNEEETQATFAGNAPWLLEDRLRLAGAEYHKKAPWTPYAVVDGNLITGQQQVSAQVTAEAVLKRLKEIA